MKHAVNSADIVLTPEVVALARRGDEQAATMCLERMQGPIRGLVEKFSKNKPDMDYDDMIQEGGIVVLKCIQRWQPMGARFVDYAQAAVANRFRDMLEERKRRLSAVVCDSDCGDEIDFHSITEPGQDWVATRLEALRNLPPSYIPVLRARYGPAAEGRPLLGWKYVAKRTGLSIQVCKAIDAEAVAKIRDAFGED